MPDSSPVRSLADDIRARTDTDLTRLLLLRPDLARPAPADLTSLASRSATRASTQRAVDALDRAHLEVLEAIAALDTCLSADALAPWLGASPTVIAPLLHDLWLAALVWGDEGALRTTRTVVEVFGPYAAGLAPARPDRAPGRTAEEVRRLASEAPPRAAAILDRLAWGPPVGILPAAELSTEDARSGAGWLLERGLVARSDDDRIVLPREVALALRDGRVHRETHFMPPAPTGTPLDTDAVEQAGGGAAAETLQLVEEVLATWSARPPRVLRSGGLSVRDLAATARLLDVEVRRAAFVLELALGADLLADDGAEDPSWAPTAAYDDWHAGAGGARWGTLAGGWLSSVRAPHLVGRPADDGGPTNALGGGLAWPPIRGLRRDALEVLAGMSPGTSLAPESVAEVIDWRRPRRVPAELAGVVDAVLAEAEWLGITGRGALTEAGRLLLGGHRAEAEAAMAHRLPAAVEHILLQADLTAVAPGPLVGDLAQLMRLVADVESRGGATVHRFTEASIRRALDAGWTADDLLARLRECSLTPLPQPLGYLVRDVARRHGQLLVSSLRSCVRAHDETTLDLLLAHPGLGALQPRKVAPTVLLSPVAADIVLTMLRDNGFAPLPESSGGVVTIPTPEGHRAAAHRGTDRRPARVSGVDEPLARGLVATLRAGEDSASRAREAREASGIPPLPATDPTTALALIRDAIAEGHALWVGHTDHVGRTERLLLYPERVEGGRVVGSVDGRRRTLSVHRITGASP